MRAAVKSLLPSCPELAAAMLWAQSAIGQKVIFIAYRTSIDILAHVALQTGTAAYRDTEVP